MLHVLAQQLVLARQLLHLRRDEPEEALHLLAIEAARKEAEITLAEAELQAEKIVQGAHQRYTRIVDDINEMKRQRVQFEAEVRTMVAGHLKLLEAFAQDGREAGVEYLPSKKKAAEEK